MGDLNCLLNCQLAAWPKLRQQPGPGPAGSWAGPAWFKMLLGLGGNRGGGGGEKGVISCTCIITFHW